MREFHVVAVALVAVGMSSHAFARSLAGGGAGVDRSAGALQAAVRTRTNKAASLVIGPSSHVVTDWSIQKSIDQMTRCHDDVVNGADGGNGWHGDTEQRSSCRIRIDIRFFVSPCQPFAPSTPLTLVGSRVLHR